MERPRVIEELALRGLRGHSFDHAGYRRLEPRITSRTVTIRFASAALPAGAALNVEPIVFLARECKQGLMKGALDRPQRFLTRLFFFGALLFFDEFLDLSLQGLEGCDQSGIALVLNDSTAGAGG